MSAHALASERETAIATGRDEFDAKPIELESPFGASVRTRNNSSARLVRTAGRSAGAP